MIELTINKIKVEAHEGETILEVAKKAGVKIPHMCYVPGKEHKPSCMVCIVKNLNNGQLLPSCSSLVMDGMEIETDNDEIHEMRKMSLELLLSDHRADCEAPCVIACPYNLNVEGVLYHYDKGQYEVKQRSRKNDRHPLPDGLVVKRPLILAGFVLTFHHAGSAKR